MMRYCANYRGTYKETSHQFIVESCTSPEDFIQRQILFVKRDGRVGTKRQ